MTNNFVNVVDKTYMKLLPNHPHIADCLFLITITIPLVLLCSVAYYTIKLVIFEMMGLVETSPPMTFMILCVIVVGGVFSWNRLKHS